MPTSDFRVSTGFFEHPKTVLLRRRLGADGVLSFLQLIRFCAATPGRSSGNLCGLDGDRLEIAAGWIGDCGSLLPQLIDVGFVDAVACCAECGSACTKIHDFELHNPWVCGADARSKNAKKAANSRWQKKKSKQDVNAGRMRGALRPALRKTCDAQKSQCSDSDSDSVSDSVTVAPAWVDGEKIQTLGDLESAAAASWGWSVQLGSKIIAKAHRILQAGPIEPHEIVDAKAAAEAKAAPENRLSFFLGAVEVARRNYETEASKQTSSPRPKTQREEVEEREQARMRAKMKGLIQ